MDEFRKDVETLLNRHSKENGSNTPDFILSNFLSGCLEMFDQAVNGRETWYGRKPLKNLEAGLPEPTPPVEVPPEDAVDAIIWWMKKGQRYRYRTCPRCGKSYDFYMKGKLFFFSSQCKCNGMAPENINRVSENAIRNKAQWLKKAE
jgi:hypothetical protein